MKELSIEQKAQRYGEAVEKLRILHDYYDTVKEKTKTMYERPK